MPNVFSKLINILLPRKKQLTQPPVNTLQTRIRTRLRKPHEKWEGVMTRAYICPAGYLSIGIGHNCIAKPVAGVTKKGDIISLLKVEELYKADCADVFAALDARLPWWRTLPEARAAVLFDMCFNMGIGWPPKAGKPGRGLLSFSNTLAAIKNGDYTTAASMMMQSKWARQVGDGISGRFDRAEAMAAQMATGVWQV